MPKENLQWKVSDAKRLLRAVQKQGFADRCMSLLKHPDGTLTLSIASRDSPARDNALDKWLGEHPDEGQTQGHQ